MFYEESSPFQQDESDTSGELVGAQHGMSYVEQSPFLGQENYGGSFTADYTGGVTETQLAGNNAASNVYYSSSSLDDGKVVGQMSDFGVKTGDEQEHVSTAFVESDTGFATSNLEQQQSTETEAYKADAQGLYQDPNPEIVRRQAPGSPQTYTQRVLLRFLQPPPVPPPGPLIIKEVRPPQPPPPPPLFIRQRPPPPPTLPPLVIREAPPKLPPALGTQVITKMLPPLPVPPRSVIIERLPPQPPRPRDVIVERWLPYRVQEKRRVIIQRAPPPVIPKPRNIIICYDQPKAQVVRRFQNLGVQRANPTEYVQRYGTELEDTNTLLVHARNAGVVEDISLPAGFSSNLQSSSYETHQSVGSAMDTSLNATNYATVSSSTGAYNVNGVGTVVDGGGFSAGETNELNSIGDFGYNLASNIGEFSSNSFGSSASYSAVSGLNDYTAGLNLASHLNTGVGSSDNYESYSTQQTFIQ